MAPYRPRAFVAVVAGVFLWKLRNRVLSDPRREVRGKLDASIRLRSSQTASLQAALLSAGLKESKAMVCSAKASIESHTSRTEAHSGGGAEGCPAEDLPAMSVGTL